MITSANYVSLALKTEAPITPELVQRLEHYARALHATMGVHTEGGELHDRFKRIVFYGEKADLTNAAEEVGDILWYLAILCDFLNISFDQCMQANIAKLAARYRKKGVFDAASALERELADERQILDEHFTPKENAVANQDWEKATELQMEEAKGKKIDEAIDAMNTIIQQSKQKLPMGIGVMLQERWDGLLIATGHGFKSVPATTKSE